MWFLLKVRAISVLLTRINIKNSIRNHHLSKVFKEGVKKLKPKKCVFLYIPKFILENYLLFIYPGAGRKPQCDRSWGGNLIFSFPLLCPPPQRAAFTQHHLLLVAIHWHHQCFNKKDLKSPKMVLSKVLHCGCEEVLSAHRDCKEFLIYSHLFPTQQSLG